MFASVGGFIVFVLWLAAIATVGLIAHRKGRDRLGWSLAALGLGPLALIVVIAAPRLTSAGTSKPA